MAGFWLRGWAAALLVAMTLLLPGAALTAPALPAGMDEAQYNQLVDAIVKAVVAQLKTDGATAPKPAAAPAEDNAGVSVDENAGGAASLLAQRFDEIMTALPKARAEFERMKAQMSREDRGGRSTGGFIGLLLLTVIVGVAVERGVAMLVARLRDRHRGSVQGLQGVKKLAALALADIVSILALIAVVHGLSALWFSGADMQSRTAGIVISAIVTWRVVLAVLRYWLRPDFSDGRIAALEDHEAKILFAAFAVGILVLLGGRAWVVTLLAGKAPREIVTLAALSMTTLTSLVFLFCVLAARRPMATLLSDMIEDATRPVIRLIQGAAAKQWWIAGIVFVGAMFVAQTYGVIFARYAAANGLLRTLVFILGLVMFESAMDYIARRLVPPGLINDSGSADPRITDVVVRCLRVAVRIFVIVAIIEAWAVDVLDVVPANEWKATTRSLVSAGSTLFLAYVAWQLVRFFTDRHVRAGGPVQAGDNEDDSTPPPTGASRLRTMLPLLRLALGVTIVILAVLIALSELGVNIGPLLAGASVFGLAISFGSQALVKDIVSGVFFLADDAFRVGEYIDCGKAKGTVEGMTIRSVKLRHQNGQVHTIPFGQLGSITNFSRDWTTVKFNLRLARDTDLETVRKVTKKIGVELLADPDMAQEFIEPLKMQGVADIADNALIVRFKFTAKPTKPSFLQRQAVKRLLQVFPEKGIEFASSAVTVQTLGGAADIAAHGAAAAQAAAAAAAPVQPG